MMGTKTGILERMRNSLGGSQPVPEIAVGSRFAQLSHTSPVWIVERIARPASSLHEHVTLRREDDPQSLKTLSVDALWTGGEFREIAQY